MTRQRNELVAQNLVSQNNLSTKINDANINYKARVEMHPIIWLPKKSIPVIMRHLRHQQQR